MPAEFAVDPLGTGARSWDWWISGSIGKQVDALNKAGAGGSNQAALVVPQEKPFSHETVEFMLPPGGSIEYKYRLEKGETLLYSWKTAAPIDYEFHAEPDGAPRGYAQSYEKSHGPGQNSTLRRAVQRDPWLVLGEHDGAAGDRLALDGGVLQPRARIPHQRAGAEQVVPVTRRATDGRGGGKQGR